MSNEKRCSEPVSRILCPFASPFASFEASGSLRATIIPLVPALLTGSSNLPGSAIGPIEMLPYLVLLRAGFGLPRLLPAARWALTPPFHPYSPPPSALRAPDFGGAGPFPGLPRRSTRLEEPRAKAGGMFSVPLSVGSPRPGVTRRTALWSSDFPPPRRSPRRGVGGRRSPGSLHCFRCFR
jgi:hypothetical protein